MAKYAKYQRKSERKPEGVHPIWRGIGCILIIIVPIISYALGSLLAPVIIQTGYVPYQILGRLRFPVQVQQVVVVRDLANFLSSIDNFWFTIILFFVILLLLTGFFSMVYTAVYQYVGPKRYTAVDAPPTKYKPKVYKR